MARLTHTFGLIAGGFALATGLFVGVPGVLFRLDPVTQIVVVQRARMESAGLSKRALEGEGLPPLTYFEGKGEGEPAALIHGFGDHAGTWAALVPALDDAHRLLLPDLPGHGESPLATPTLAFEDLTRALERLLAREAPGEPLTLVGNSLGGMVALRFALDHPGQVRRLVLVNSAGLAHPLPKRLIWATTPEDFAEKLRLIQGPRWPAPTPDFVVHAYAEDAAARPHLGALYDDLASGRHFVEGPVAGLPPRVDLVWGSEDGYFPLDYARRMNAALPGSTLTVLEGCGHMPQIACPEELLKIVLDSGDL